MLCCTVPSTCVWHLSYAPRGHASQAISCCAVLWCAGDCELYCTVSEPQQSRRHEQAVASCT